MNKTLTCCFFGHKDSPALIKCEIEKVILYLIEQKSVKQFYVGTHMLLLRNKFYISLVRNDAEFMRYHFTDAYAREKDGEGKKVPDGLAERAEVIFRLLMSYTTFDSTALYANFRDDVVSGLKTNLRRGHILLNGTNATLFGNGPELLQYIAGEKITSELKKGQIHSKRFANGVKLL